MKSSCYNIETYKNKSCKKKPSRERTFIHMDRDSSPIFFFFFLNPMELFPPIVFLQIFFPLLLGDLKQRAKHQEHLMNSELPCY